MFPVIQKIEYNENPINTNPLPKNIPLFVSDVVALYNKILPTKPRNKIKTPRNTRS
jgi:hypothetical protein